MLGRGSDGRRGGGSPHGWRAEVTVRIMKEAEGAQRRVPSYFRRFDALRNKDYPSIFKRRHKTNHRVGGVATSLPCSSLPAGSSSNQTAPPPQQLSRNAANDVGCSGGGGVPGQLIPATVRDVVVAAVGPYHHHLPVPTPALITRAKKCGIVKFLASWFGLDTADFLGWARRNETRASGCYERDSFTMSSEKLAEMLLLDGCLLLFAVFLLRASVCEDQRPSKLAREPDRGEEFIYLSADITLHMKQTRIDLLMLDNQIPFFVLAELHKRLKGTLFKEIDHSIEELALSCFDDIHPSGFRLWQQQDRVLRRWRSGSGSPQDSRSRDGGGTGAVVHVHHLLHLFHLSRVPAGRHKVDVDSILPREPESHLPSATELEELPTSFKRTPPGSYSMHIAFRRTMLGMRGVMSIPALCIHGYSDCVFRSLIEFEQKHLRCGLGVTAYSICMARLLQGEADVKVLRKRGILGHTQKTDKEIVHFFKDLRDEYGDTLMPGDLLALCRNVTAHRRSKARRLMKGILLQCFPRQTVTFFVIFGTIISMATLINTVHTMYRYYHPYKRSSPSYYGP